MQAALVYVTRKGARPSYRIMPAHEVPGCEGYPPPKLALDEQELFNQLASGKTFVPAKGDRDWHNHRSPRTTVADLVMKERARAVGERWPNHYYAIVYDADAAQKPDWIWLPNAIIDGTVGETAPVELVRQTQNGATLRLLIDLYHAHALASDGGIHWRSIRREFTRRTVGQRGPFIVYGFEPGESRAWGNKHFIRAHMTGKLEALTDGKPQRDRGWSIFWNAWDQLVNLGLIDLVGQLVEADNDTANVIHPYAVGNGETAERAIARAAHEAAAAMLTETQQDSATSKALHLVPIRAHITEVQMVGIARLRYRPRTSATAAWFARMAEWNELTERYVEMAGKVRQNAAWADMQHQGLSR